MPINNGQINNGGSGGGGGSTDKVGIITNPPTPNSPIVTNDTLNVFANKTQAQINALISGTGSSQYDPTKTYNTQNLVVYQGSIWECLVNGTINISPSNLSINWQQISTIPAQYYVQVAANGTTTGNPFYDTIVHAQAGLVAKNSGVAPSFSVIECIGNVVLSEIIAPIAGQMILGNSTVNNSSTTGINILYDNVTISGFIINSTGVALYIASLPINWNINNLVLNSSGDRGISTDGKTSNRDAVNRMSNIHIKNSHSNNYPWWGITTDTAIITYYIDNITADYVANNFIEFNGLNPNSVYYLTNWDKNISFRSTTTSLSKYYIDNSVQQFPGNFYGRINNYGTYPIRHSTDFTIPFSNNDLLIDTSTTAVNLTLQGALALWQEDGSKIRITDISNSFKLHNCVLHATAPTTINGLNILTLNISGTLIDLIYNLTTDNYVVQNITDQINTGQYTNYARVTTNGVATPTLLQGYALLTQALATTISTASQNIIDMLGVTITDFTVSQTSNNITINGNNSTINGYYEATTNNIVINDLTIAGTSSQQTPFYLNGCQNVTLNNVRLKAYDSGHLALQALAGAWGGLIQINGGSVGDIKIIGGGGGTECVLSINDIQDASTITMDSNATTLIINNCPNLIIANTASGAIYIDGMQQYIPIKTASFTAVQNAIYNVSTSSSVVIVTMPTLITGINNQIGLIDKGGNANNNNILVITPTSSTATIATTLNSATITVTAGSLAIGQYITGAGIPAGTTIEAITPSIQLSNLATATATGVTATAYNCIATIATNYGVLLLNYDLLTAKWVIQTQAITDIQGNSYTRNVPSWLTPENNQLVPWSYITSQIPQLSTTNTLSIWVSGGGGSDTGKGTIFSQFKTLSKALSIVTGSGVIQADTSTYSDVLTISKANVTFTVQSQTNLWNYKATQAATISYVTGSTRGSWFGFQFVTGATECVQHTSNQGILNFQNCGFITTGASFGTLGANITSNTFNYFNWCDFTGSSTAYLNLADNTNNIFTATITNGSPTLATVTGILPALGQFITGNGIPAGALIISVSPFIMSLNATISGTGVTLYNAISWYPTNCRGLRLNIGLGHIVIANNCTLGENGSTAALIGHSENYLQIDTPLVTTATTKANMLLQNFANFGGIGYQTVVTADSSPFNNGLWQCIAYPFTSTSSSWTRLVPSIAIDVVAPLIGSATIVASNQFNTINISAPATFTLPLVNSVAGILYKFVNLSTSTAAATIGNYVVYPGQTLMLESDGANFQGMVLPQLNPSSTSITNAGGTTTLTATSQQVQIFTGIQTQTVVMPVVSTCKVAQFWRLINASNTAMAINSSGGNLIEVLKSWSVSIIEVAKITGTDNTSWYSSGSIGINANNFIANFTTTISSTTPFVMTYQSSQVQIFTGTAIQPVNLPAANTLYGGTWFKILNNTTQTMSIRDGSATALFSLPKSMMAKVMLTNSGGTAGVWYYSLSNTQGGFTEVIANQLAGTTQSFVTATETVITVWNNIQQDVLNQWNTTTGVFTANSNGLYFVAASLGFVTNGVGVRYLEVYKNTSTNMFTLSSMTNPSATNLTEVYGSRLIRLVQNDTVTIKGAQTSGANLSTTDNIYVNQIHICKISE